MPRPRARRWVSVPQAALYFQTNTETFYRKVRIGEITGYRLGPRLIRVDLNEIEAQLQPIKSDDNAA